MDIRTRIYRAGAVVPAVVLSAVLLLAVSAMLPATLAGLLIVAYVAVAIVLGMGRLDAPAVQVLGRARRATPGEERLLGDLARWLDARGVAVPDLYVARADVGRPAAASCGRHSVLIAPRVLGWLHRRQASQEVVAAVVAQAAAGLRVGPARFDLALRLLTLPGAVVLAGFVRVARWFTWVPGVMTLWRIRAVFGLVAVWQTLHAGQLAIGVTTGVLIAVSYTGPACARAWRRRVEVDADRIVAQMGLGVPLELAVRAADEPGSIDRVERIRRGTPAIDSTDHQSGPIEHQLHLVR